MADYSGRSAEAGQARPRMDQIVGECFVRAAHIVLGARVAQSPRVAIMQGHKPWFNLELEDVECAQAAVEHWKTRLDRPMVLEIFLLPWAGSTTTEPEVPPESPGQPSTSAGRTLLERWVMHYQVYKSREEAEQARMGRVQHSRLETPQVYKRMVIMIRSLFSYVRILPAYRLYRACKRNRVNAFSLQYRISAGDPATACLPLPSHRMQHFGFTPIETPFGFLQMSVDFRPSTTVTILEQTTSPPSLPQIIADYIGGTGLVGERSPAGPRSNLSASLSDGRAQHLPDPASSPPVTSGAGILRAPYVSQQRHFALVPQNVIATRAASVPGQFAGQRALPRSYTHADRQTELHHTQNTPLLQQQGFQPKSPGTGATPLTGRPPPAPPVSLPAPRTSSAGPSPASLGASPLAPQTPGTSYRTSFSTPPKYPSSVSGSPRTPGGGSLPRGAVTRGASSLGPAGRGALARDHPLVGAFGAFGEDDSELDPEIAGSVSDALDLAVDQRQGVAAQGRQISAPVCIPGAANPRAISSDHLWALGQQQGSERDATGPRTPASAPAAPNMMSLTSAASSEPPRPQSKGSQRVAGAVGGTPRVVVPATPPTLLTTRSLESESEGSTSSSYPTSCSPNLPFAFTPSGYSVASLADQQAVSYGERMTNASPSGRISVREVSALALRRPSWTSSRSSGQGEPGSYVPQNVGYSVSPMHDSILDSGSIFSSSTPRHVFGIRDRPPLPSPASSPLLLPISSGVSSVAHIPRLTLGPPALPVGDVDVASLACEESEADILPFALDTEIMGSVCDPLRPPGSASGHGDEAVGAFVRLLQGAPPLRRTSPGTPGLPPPSPGTGGTSRSPSGREMSVQAGLDQLARVKARLQAMPSPPT